MLFVQSGIYKNIMSLISLKVQIEVSTLQDCIHLRSEGGCILAEHEVVVVLGKPVHHLLLIIREFSGLSWSILVFPII